MQKSQKSKKSSIVRKVKKVPVASGVVKGKASPSIRSKGNRVVVSHSEYVTEVLSSTQQFDLQYYPINPGMSLTFPWLSSIAPSYESYRFNKLVFQYETEAPTSTPGYLCLAADYDASDPDPSTKVEAMSYDDSVRSPPWSSCSHDSKVNNLHKRTSYFVRMGEIPEGESITLYDTGSFYTVVGNNNTDETFMGELWVHYEVELITPQIPVPINFLNAASGLSQAQTDPWGRLAPLAYALGGLDFEVSGLELTFNENDYWGLLTYTSYVDSSDGSLVGISLFGDDSCDLYEFPIHISFVLDTVNSTNITYVIPFHVLRAGGTLTMVYGTNAKNLITSNWFISGFNIGESQVEELSKVKSITSDNLPRKLPDLKLSRLRRRIHRKPRRKLSSSPWPTSSTIVVPASKSPADLRTVRHPVFK